MSEQNKGYQGWRNYETWAVKLWLDNEEGSYLTLREMTKDAWKRAEADASFTRKENAALTLADAIKDWIEELNPLADQASVFSDLLTAALGEVDWQEIADACIEDEDLEDEEEDEETEQTTDG